MLVCHTYKKLIPFRLAIHVMTQIEQCGLQKQWTWEPMMGESLILALVDNNDVRLLTLSYPSLHLTGYLLLFFTVLIIGCAASWESHLGTCIPSTEFDFWASIFVLECIFTLCYFSGSKICCSTGKVSYFTLCQAFIVT